MAIQPIQSMTPEEATPVSKYKSTKTVLVLGASYAGYTAAQSLVKGLPVGWRVVVLERNTHFNHLYAFPRVAVLPSHENKVFVPCTKIFEPLDGVPPHASTAGHVMIHGCLTKLDLSPSGKGGKAPFGRGVATYRPLNEGSSCCRDPTARQDDTMQIRFDFLVYALGCHLPPPINLWSSPAAVQKTAVEGATLAKPTTCCMSSVSAKLDARLNLNDGATDESTSAPPPLPPCRGSKKEGVAWLQEAQARVRKAKSVVVIGGGALGVQFATDIAAYYGTATSPPSAEHRDATRGVPVKRVALLCSSKQLLPRFDVWMHDRALEVLHDLGVDVLLGARADLSKDALEGAQSEDGEERVIKTLDGRQVSGELVLFCTGQTPCTNYLFDALSEADRASIDAKGMCKVNRYLQLAIPASLAAVHEQRERGEKEKEEEDHEPQTRPSIENIFVVGDVADAFGALNAGHTAWAQAKLAAANICSLIESESCSEDKESTKSEAMPMNLSSYDTDSIPSLRSSSSSSSSSASASSSSSSSNDSLPPSQPHPHSHSHSKLQRYTPPPPSIKVSLGLQVAIVQHHGSHGIKRGKEDGLRDDLNSDVMWTSRGLSGEENGYVE